jgi:NADPH:quinone reductase-like Zn-dependent oxidoreductase
MKSIFIVKHASPDKSFELRTLADPEPAAGEVRIKVEASGLNFADVLARMGFYPDAPPLPFVAGYEVVGRIEKIGPNPEAIAVAGGSVRLPKAGDRVLTFTKFGGYSSHTISKSSEIVVIPETLSAGVAAALATQYCTSWIATHEMMRLRKGENVLVHAAAGGVGIGLVQLAKREGCIVFGTVGSSAKEKFVREQGADHVINYKTEDFEEKVRSIVGTRGVDVIFDSVGGRTFSKGMKLLAPAGRMVTFGIANVASPKKNPLRMLTTMVGFGLYHPGMLLSKSQSIIGLNLFKIAQGRPDLIRESLRQVVELTLNGELKPHAGATFRFDQIAQAHELLQSGKSMGKVIITWD